MGVGYWYLYIVWEVCGYCDFVVVFCCCMVFCVNGDVLCFVFCFCFDWGCVCLGCVYWFGCCCSVGFVVWFVVVDCWC